MMKFFSRTKGAVSIFLVIILVPMLAVASVMVDSSRLKLGQAAASAAGDITLNTALSQYNNMLKDIYGLFATSQNNESLLESLGTYYKECIEVNGVNASDANTYVEKIMNTFGAGGSTASRDLLNIAVDDFTVSAPEGANLANPLMLKKQITEFMKYRAPLNLGLEILDAVKIFKNLSKQTKVIEKQQKYYEEQKKIFSLCEDAWSHFYDYSMEDYVPTEYYYNKMVWNFKGKDYASGKYTLDEDDTDNFETYYDKLALVSDHIALYLSNYKYYTNPAIKGKSVDSTKIMQYKNNNYETELNLNSSISYKSGKTTYDDVRDAIAAVEKAIGKVKRMQKDNEQYKKYALALKGTLSEREQVEIVEQFNREYDKDNNQWIKAILELKAAYQSLLNAKENIPNPLPSKPTKPTEPAVVNAPGAKPSDPGTKPTDPGTSATSSQKAAYSSALSQWNSASKAVSDWYAASSAYYTYIHVTLPNYNTAVAEWKEEVKKWERKYLDDKGCKLNHAGEETATCDYANGANGATKNSVQATNTLNSAKEYLKNFSKITCKINDFYNNKKDYVTKLMIKDAKVIIEVKKDSKDLYFDNLTTKIAALQAAKSTLGQIYTISVSLDGKLADWELAANDSDLNDDETTIAQREEIANLKGIIKSDEIKALETRVGNVKASLEKTLEELKAFKVGSKNLWELPVSEADMNKTTIDFETAKDIIKDFKALLTVNPYNINYAPIMNSDNTDFDMTHKDIWTRSYKSGVITTSWADDSNPNPSVSFGQTRFYQYLYANFDTGEKPKTGKVAEGEGEEEKQTDKAEEKAEESKTAVENDNKNKSKNEVTNMSNKPSSSWAAVCAAIESNSMNSINTSNEQDLGNVTNGIEKLFEGLFEAISGALVKVRDCLYLDSYIMNMFSYDTFEAEIVYNMQVDSGASDPKGMPISDDFWNGSTANSKYSAEIEKAKSMTLTPITPDNNFAYGAEVEYILYGGTNSSNITKAYATIFGIRLALNLVYAFTDSEIRDGAFAIASALFGVPPLTVLIPAAKIAIIIAIAIAESAYDLYLLKQGRAVPIYKSKDTWNMKLSSIIGNAASGVVNAAIDKGTNLLTNWLEKTSDELSDLINKNKEKFAEAMGKAIDDKFDKYALLPLEQLSEECTAANMMEACGDFTKIEDKVAHVEKKLDDWLSKQSISGQAQDVIYEIKANAVEVCKGQIENMFNALEKSAQGQIDAVEKTIESIRKKIRESVSNAIDQVGNGLNTVKNNIINEIEDAAAKGADNLKDLITSNIDVSFGQSSTSFAQKGTTSVLSSILSWQYSDYMNLFLLIATLANEEKVLLRTADVIQANMQHINKKAGISDVFLMEKANTYLKVEAKVQVKPLMLALPMIQETTKNQLSGVNWYTISYSATKGY
ncbi:MAG: DUF5702 domain-containing protein [Acutalibacteraceae bacterium]